MRFAILIFVCAPCWGQGIVVELLDSRVRAADLVPAVEAFAGADSTLDLGPAPAPGVRRRVTQGQLLRWLRQAGVEAEADTLPAEVTLLRKLRVWPANEAAELLRGLLAEQAEVTPESIQVSLEGFGAPEIPAGSLEWSLLALPSALDRPVRLGLRWQDAGGRSGVESVTAAMRARAQALVATADLPRGSEASLADFALGDVDMVNLRTVYLSVLQQDQRFILRQDIRVGDALTEGLIEARPDVERGAVVELLIAIGAVRLRAPARAEGSGSTGDLIPFRNLATNQRVLARVADARTAEVPAP